MMRRVLLLLAAVVGVPASAGPVAVAPLVSAPLVVDADPTEWNFGLHSVAPVLSFGGGAVFVEEGSVRDESDQSARVAFAIQGTELLVGAIVRDDSVVTVRGGEQWKGDGFELLFPRAGKPMLHLGLNPVGDLHVYSKTGDSAEARIRAAARPEVGGWLFELAIPLQAIGASAQTASVPMNLAMRDVDEGEGAPAHRVWSGQKHSQAVSAGKLLFDRTPPVAPTWPKCQFTGGPIRLRSPLGARGSQLVAQDAPVVLRMLNFQGARRNWQAFWTDWDVEQLRRELSVAKRLKANAIRVFVFTEAFGEDQLRPEMLERLHVLVREAAGQGMVSVVTFFPFKKEFRPEWRDRMQRHLEYIVSSFRGDPAVAMWDLMNEPDHAWAAADAGVSASDVESWSKRMFDAVKRADDTHLVTVGLFGHYLAQQPPSAAEELPFTDVASVHWYGETTAMEPAFKRMANTSRPVILQEFGATSLHFTDDEAADHYRRVCQLMKANRFAGAGAWELFDHPVGSIAHQKPRWSESVENAFGLVTADGRPKKQAETFCTCFPGTELRIETQPR